MNRIRPLLLLAVVLGLSGALISKWRQRPLPLLEKAERLNSRRGSAMADLAGKVLPRGAKVVLFTWPANGDADVQLMEDRFRARAIRAGLSIAAVEYLGTARRLADGMEPEEPLSAKRVRALHALHPGLDAVVSLCGNPKGPAAGFKGLPPFICLCDKREGIPELMRAEVVIAAYVPRYGALGSGRSNNWFDALYEEVLPGTVDRVYATAP